MRASLGDAGPSSGDSFIEEAGLCRILWRGVERLLLRGLLRMKKEVGKMRRKMGRRVGRQAAIM